MKYGLLGLHVPLNESNESEILPLYFFTKNTPTDLRIAD